MEEKGTVLVSQSNTVEFLSTSGYQRWYKASCDDLLATGDEEISNEMAGWYGMGGTEYFEPKEEIVQSTASTR